MSNSHIMGLLNRYVPDRQSMGLLEGMALGRRLDTPQHREGAPTGFFSERSVPQVAKPNPGQPSGPMFDGRVLPGFGSMDPQVFVPQPGPLAEFDGQNTFMADNPGTGTNQMLADAMGQSPDMSRGRIIRS